MRLKIVDGTFRDTNNRQVVLRGINASGAINKGALIQQADLEAIHGWGMNAIRYVLFWADIEPECGAYNEAKFEEIGETLDWAQDLGIHVLLDFHQDLYNESPGGGMPIWTVVEPDLPHVHQGRIWSTAYFESQLVQTAFDHFWDNSPGPDGVGIQDRFALAWQEMARRFGTHPAVLGYDLLNEPFPGSPVVEAMMAATEEILQAANTPPTEDLTPFERALTAFSLAEGDPLLFSAFTDSVGPALSKMDSTRLQPMFKRVTAAIREIDIVTPIFIEPFITTNLGFLPTFLRSDDLLEDTVVFAPHIYDADSGKSQQLALDLVEFGVGRKMPVVIGEWGNLDNSDGIYETDPLPGGRAVMELLDAAAAGSMYWVYHQKLRNDPFFPEFVTRPYPRATAGDVLDFTADFEHRQISLRWNETEDASGFTEIVLPTTWFPNDFIVTCDGNWTLEPIGEMARLLVLPGIGAGERNLTIRG